MNPSELVTEASIEELTVSGLRALVVPRRVGDVIFLPRVSAGLDTILLGAASSLFSSQAYRLATGLRTDEVPMHADEVARFEWLSGNIRNGLLGLPAHTIHVMDVSMHFRLVMDCMGNPRGIAPEWFARAHVELQRCCWRNYCQTVLDPFVIMNELANSGISYMIIDDGFVADVWRCLELGRLHRIRQLGMLHQPIGGLDCERKVDAAMHFPHTRAMHSLDVYVLACVLARRLGLSEKEALHLKVAALSHDRLTPAGGDTMMMVAREALDEDAHFRETFALPGWAELKQLYPLLDEDLLFDIIQNKGWLGQLMNFIDKIGYTSRDLGVYLSLCGTDQPSTELMRLRSLADEPVTSLWENIRLTGNAAAGAEDEARVAYFDNSERLRRFLELRALMFSLLYYNPMARIKERLMACFFLRYLWVKGEITRDMLLEWGDDELERFVAERLSAPGVESFLFDFGQAQVLTFSTKAEALTAEEEILAEHDGVVVTVVEPFVGPKPGQTKSFPVLVTSSVTSATSSSGVQGGPPDIQLFSEACPAEAAAIDAVPKIHPPWVVYALPLQRIHNGAALLVDIRQFLAKHDASHA